VGTKNNAAQKALYRKNAGTQYSEKVNNNGARARHIISPPKIRQIDEEGMTTHNGKQEYYVGQPGMSAVEILGCQSCSCFAHS